MANAPITTAERPDIDHRMSDKATECNVPDVVVIETTSRDREIESASPRSSGVLRELALARWRGPASVSVPASAEGG